MRVFTPAIACFVLLAMPSLAGECSSYEASVASLWRRAESFQQGAAFREFGFSPAGPTDGWINEFRRLRDFEEEARAFSQKYGFAVADIYMVADSYRTDGVLDAYFADLRKEFFQLDTCK
ncbi:hypothetical protein [Pseudothioclava arenosa]|uniref:hypothetical protein n=1 Tax=Pseudothioclava arenosa TaxID=1795308 RepID=UPI00117E1102|nr:hypothetical protein [Pseudothioclava arenosa]